MTGLAAPAPKAPGGKRPRGGAKAVTRVPVGFDTSVFVNCPFDDEYLPLLHALLFAIHDCGFVARTAVEDSGAAEQRIAKICRLIHESRLSIHDISRIELSEQRYPRFNMPFEAGIAYGAINFGKSANRDMLVLEAEPRQGQITLSDLAGTDPKAHAREPGKMVAAVRAFLARKKTQDGRTRGADAILKRYARFNDKLPTVADSLDITLAEIQSFDYLNEWLQTMSVWVLNN